MSFFSSEEIDDPMKLADKLYHYLGVFFHTNADLTYNQLKNPSIFNPSRAELDLRKREMQHSDDFMTLISEVKKSGDNENKHSPANRQIVEKIILRLQVITSEEEKTTLASRKFVKKLKKVLSEMTGRYSRVFAHMEEMKNNQSPAIIQKKPD